MLLLLLAACGDDAPGASGDSLVAIPADSAAPGAPAPAATGWDGRVGPVLLVAGEHAGDAMVVYPQLQGEAETDTLDAARYVGETALLIGRRGLVDSVALAAPGAPDPESTTCTPWPVLAAARPVSGWTVGFIANAVDVVPLDSLHALAPRDSSQRVSDIARLASALVATREGQQASSFRGLPFAVQDARTFPAGAIEVVVANVIRRVNQEDNPLEEHTLLIAERPAGGGDWKTTFSERLVGHEETVTRQELLAVVRYDALPTLVLAHDSSEGVTYSLVQRTAGGRWRTIWRSARARC